MSGQTVGPHGRTVAARAHRLRLVRRLSQAAVVTAMAQAGHPIPRSALSDIELGLRRLDVDDLHALAAALGVAPALLLDASACEHCHGAPQPMTACLGCGAKGAR